MPPQNLHRALNSSWDHTQVASLANTGVSFAGMATVEVGARAVHSGLRSLRAQALRVHVGTSAHSRQAEQLTKLADSLPISTRSLFGEGLQQSLPRPRPPPGSTRIRRTDLYRLVWSGPDPPSLTNIRTATRGRGTLPLPSFVLGVASPPTRAGATGPPLGGNHSTIVHRGHRSPPWCKRPLLATRTSPRASPKVVRAEVDGTPR